MGSRYVVAVLAVLWLSWGAVAPSVHGQIRLPEISSVTFSPNPVAGGETSTGTITLAYPSPVRTTQMRIEVTDPDKVVESITPRDIFLPRDTAQATFQVKTRTVQRVTLVAITVVRPALSERKEAVLEVRPPGPFLVPTAILLSDRIGFAPLGDPRSGDVAAPPDDTVLRTPRVVVGAEDQDPDDRLIRGIAPDGSLIVVDSAGTALLRLSAVQGTRSLLDATSRDAADGIGISRLLRVETNREGATAVIALRADNTRRIYRVEGDTPPIRVADLPDDPAVTNELAISASGQISYASRTPAGALGVFQAQRGAEGVSLPLDQLTDVRQIAAIRNLQSTEAGDLVFLLILQSSGMPDLAVRQTSAGLQPAARTGQAVRRAGDDTTMVPLAHLRRPRMGADGTVVFLGESGSGVPPAVNFYISRLGRDPEPMLAGTRWLNTPADFDYEVAANGMVALRAAASPLFPSNQPSIPQLFVSAPGGQVSRVETGRLQPQGRPVFATVDQLLFLAADPTLPLDRDGNPAVSLYRSRILDGRPEAPMPVTILGQEVKQQTPPDPNSPQSESLQLLSVTQRPVIAGQQLAFVGRLAAGTGSGNPSVGYLTQSLAEPSGAPVLVAKQGDASLLVSGTNGIPMAIIRGFSLLNDGRLLLEGLSPGAAPMLHITGPAGASGVGGPGIAAATPIQAPAPLLREGFDLGRDDQNRELSLTAVLGPPHALGPGQELVTARFSYKNSTDGGEGLFLVGRSQQVTPLGLTGENRRSSPAGLSFTAFADNSTTAGSPDDFCFNGAPTTDYRTLGLPSVATEGSGVNLVFKALATRAGAPVYGLFKWSGGGIESIGLEEDATLTAGQVGPLNLAQWAAGPSGSCYLMVRPRGGGPARLLRCVARPVSASTTIESWVAPEASRAGAGRSAPDDLQNFVLDGGEQLFVQGTFAGRRGVYRVPQPGQYLPVVQEGQALSPMQPGQPAASDLVFGDAFGLLPDSRFGGLLFRAAVVNRRTGVRKRGLFSLDAAGPHIVLIEGLTIRVRGSIAVAQLDDLSDTLDRQAGKWTAFAALIDHGTRWAIFRQDRSANANDSELVVQEGPQPDGSGPITLDPSQLLGFPCRSGPLFSINEQGLVAYMASDHKQWRLWLWGQNQ